VEGDSCYGTHRKLKALNMIFADSPCFSQPRFVLRHEPAPPHLSPSRIWLDEIETDLTPTLTDACDEEHNSRKRPTLWR